MFAITHIKYFLLEKLCKLSPEKKREVYRQLPLSWKIFLKEEKKKRKKVAPPSSVELFNEDDREMATKGGDS